jgi:hypothetical protein
VISPEFKSTTNVYPAPLDYTFIRDGIPQIDARNNVYYIAAGNSPAMMETNVGSQYLWTYRDTAGNFLDGAKSYKLHILPNSLLRNSGRSSFMTLSVGRNCNTDSRFHQSVASPIRKSTTMSATSGRRGR